MDEQQVIILGVTVIGLLSIFIIFFQRYKKKEERYIVVLEDEIYKLKLQIRDQEKAQKIFKNDPQNNRVALDQIKKIESLEGELKKQEKRISDLKSILQEANKIKSNFLMNVQSEIRMPVKSIILFSQHLMQESKNTKAGDYAKKIHSSAEKLLEMIDEMIELSSVQKGTFTLHEKPIDLKQKVEKLVAFYKESAKKKRLDLKLEIDEKFPDALILDGDKVEDICRNLIENAVKFTQQGYVHIKLEQLKKNIATNSIDFSLTVADSGIGISQENQKKIFEVFESAIMNEKESGMGLGLSLNKRIAREMNGDITVYSQENKGSVFTFTLHEAEVVLLNAASEVFNAESIDFSVIQAENATIMVIDEDHTVRNLLRDVFFDTKIKVLTFDNPRDAIELLKQNSVSMILVDLDVLSQDDNAVAKIIKGMSSAPVVTLLKERMYKRDLQATGLNIAGHLRKPIAKAELFKISLHLLNQ